MIFILTSTEICLYNDIHYFSVGLRTGSNSSNINLFRSHLGIYYLLLWRGVIGFKHYVHLHINLSTQF